MADFVWFREEAPWLGPAFVYTIHEDAIVDLRRMLDENGFRTLALDGARMTDADSLHQEIKRAFGFPEWCGHSWDSFDDCIGEIDLTRPTAVVWNAAEQLAAADLKSFAEAMATFVRLRDRMNADEVQWEIFLVGSGSGFRRAADPLPPGWALPPDHAQ